MYSTQVKVTPFGPQLNNKYYTHYTGNHQKFEIVDGMFNYEFMVFFPPFLFTVWPPILNNIQQPAADLSA